MRELNLTDAQFEHTLGILAEVDLAPLLAAFSGGGRMVDMLAILPALTSVREKRIFRRLEAVWSADPDTFENAEASPDILANLERQAARKPIKDTLEGLSAFFDGLGLSLNASRGSSVNEVLMALTKLQEKDPAPVELPTELPATPPSPSDA